MRHAAPKPMRRWSGFGRRRIQTRSRIATRWNRSPRRPAGARSNGNDAGKAILRAVSDARLTYVLGYYPIHANWDGAYHSIKVGVKRPGASVRSRKGYFAIPSIAVGPQPAEALLDALRSPLESTEVGVSAHVERVGAASGKAGVEYAIEILVEPTAITLDKAGEVWKGSLESPDRRSLPEGRYFKTFAANMQLEFTDEQRAQMLRDGLRISRTVAPRAGAHRRTWSSATRRPGRPDR